MTEIALYNTLRKIPEVSDAEAQEAVADIAKVKEVVAKVEAATKEAAAKEVATKTDIADLKTEMANQEARLLKQIYAVAGIIIAAVGLMIKFL